MKDKVKKVDEWLTKTTVRLGVTGLSRAGKTVFITSLVAGLMYRERMVALIPALKGNILEVTGPTTLPDLKVPLFQFEDRLETLISQEKWPDGTRDVSGLRVSIRVKPEGWLADKFDRERIVHLDMMDYPGEWLLDLALMDKDRRLNFQVQRRWKLQQPVIYLMRGAPA